MNAKIVLSTPQLRGHRKIGTLKHLLLLILTGLCTLSVFTHCVQAQGLTGLYDTGVGTGSLPVLDPPLNPQPPQDPQYPVPDIMIAGPQPISLSIDPNYQIISAPSGEPTGPAAITSNTSPLAPLGSWLADTALSGWISPHTNQNGNFEAPGSYTYQTTFTVTGNPAIAQITGRVSGADVVSTIILNGQTVPNLTTSNSSAWANFTISSGFVSGTNTLQFVVQNQQASASSSGLRVEMTGTAAPPAPPTGLIATGQNNNVVLSWMPSTSATSYNVYRSTVMGGPYSAVSSPGSVSNPHYTDLNLSSGTTYYYVVTAVDGSGESGYSNEVIAVPISVASGSLPTDDAYSVSQLVPLLMTAGQAYNVSVTMGNTGLSTWAADGSYQLVSQNPAGNGTWNPSPSGSQNDSISSPVTAVGGTNTDVTFTFTVTAPSTPGTYNFQWQMANLTSGTPQFFGEPTDNAIVTVVPSVPTFLTPAQAIQTAQAYCSSNGNTITVPGNAQYAVPDADNAYWQPCWTVSFGDQATVEVVDATGVVASYLNGSSSVHGQPTGVLVSQATALQTAAAALQATSSTEQVGLPTAYLSQNNDGSHAGDSTWHIVYNRQFQGIPYNYDFVVMDIDAVSNQLISMGLTFRCTPPDNAGSAMVVTQDQAQATAQSQISVAGIQGASFQSATQQVVLPNTYWQDGEETFTPGQGKVAWVVNFCAGNPTDSETETYSVWIDAATGNIVGGHYQGEELARNTKHHAKHKPALVHKKKIATKPSIRKKPKRNQIVKNRK